MIAYIPARSGSKRIAKKNIKLLGGKPILVHVIENLKTCTFLKAICVSTDSPEISKIAKKAGAEVLELRAPDLANDFATLKDLFDKDLKRYMQHCQEPMDSSHVLFMMATAPLINGKILEKAHQLFQERRLDLLLSTVKYPISPYWALSETPEGKWKPLFPDALLERSQDLPKTEVDACLFYFLNYARMIHCEGSWMTTHHMGVFSIDPKLAIDVDTPEDWAELENQFKERFLKI